MVVTNLEIKELLGKIENDQENQRKIWKFWKILWKIKNLDCKKV